MDQKFKPGGCATLIGSQPLRDHGRACDLILEYTPDIPTWPQLPFFPREGMVPQFMSGMPGLVLDDGRYYVDAARDDFDDQLLAFFEDYLAEKESGRFGSPSRFALSAGTAQGFFSMLALLQNTGKKPLAVKGQITGPVTFCTALKDHQGRPVFYHPTLREAAVKLLARKAAWQVAALKTLGCPVILFLDEPSLAGFGSSEMISISREDVAACLQEVVDAIHENQGLAGVHVCANTDWSVLLDSGIDVINFDANGYFDKFMLYAGQVTAYLAAGHLLAWGLVPTLDVAAIHRATEENLWQDWKVKSERVAALGVPLQSVYAQALITPSCGSGSLSPELSLKVMALTRALSRRVVAECHGRT